MRKKSPGSALPSGKSVCVWRRFMYSFLHCSCRFDTSRRLGFFKQFVTKLMRAQSFLAILSQLCFIALVYILLWNLAQTVALCCSSDWIRRMLWSALVLPSGNGRRVLMIISNFIVLHLSATSFVQGTRCRLYDALIKNRAPHTQSKVFVFIVLLCVFSLWVVCTSSTVFSTLTRLTTSAFPEAVVLTLRYMTWDELTMPAPARFNSCLYAC